MKLENIVLNFKMYKYIHHMHLVMHNQQAKYISNMHKIHRKKMTKSSELELTTFKNRYKQMSKVVSPSDTYRGVILFKLD